MAKVNLSGMSVEALMDLRKRVDEMFLERRAELQKQRIAGKEGPTEISWSVRRDLGRSWRKTSLACCCDQRWQETRRFPDRQVSAEATEKAQVEALSFKLEFMVGVVMYFCSAARDFACLQRQKPAMFAQMPRLCCEFEVKRQKTSTSSVSVREPSSPAQAGLVLDHSSCDEARLNGRTFTHVVYSRQRKLGRRKTRLNVRYPTHCYPNRW